MGKWIAGLILILVDNSRIYLQARPTAYNTATLLSGHNYCMVRAWSTQGGGLFNIHSIADYHLVKYLFKLVLKGHMERIQFMMKSEELICNALYESYNHSIFKTC